MGESARPSLLAQEEKTLINKTSEATGKLSQKIAEPVRNPMAAFSTWFDFNPRVESGEKKNYNILPLFVSSPERGQGFGIKYAQMSLINRRDVIRMQAIQTLKGKSSYHLKYEFPPDVFGVEIEATYQDFGRFYYGVGGQTLEEDESEYTPLIFRGQGPDSLRT